MHCICSSTAVFGIAVVCVQGILVFTWVDYTPLKYGSYAFPPWANLLGWLISFTSVAMIPLLAGIKLSRMDPELTVSEVCRSQGHRGHRWSVGVGWVAGING